MPEISTYFLSILPILLVSACIFSSCGSRPCKTYPKFQYLYPPERKELMHRYWHRVPLSSLPLLLKVPYIVENFAPGLSHNLSSNPGPNTVSPTLCNFRDKLRHFVIQLIRMRSNPVVLEESQHISHQAQGRPPRLSRLEVRDIMKDPRFAREIAEDYEISRSLVYAIKQGRATTYLIDKAGSLDPETGKMLFADELSSLDMIIPVSAPVGGRPIIDQELYDKIKVDQRTCRQIGEEYGISRSTVSRIRSGDYCNAGKDAQPREPKIIATLDGKPIYAKRRAKKAAE